MIEGVILLWFVLTVLSLLFVVIDIRSTPASPVLKWGFVLLVAYTGVFGLFLYVLGCREPLRGTHQQYVGVRWRQVLGSAMHCVAGDGVGILAGAAIASAVQLHGLAEIGLEYVLGFGFGWTIFQALFMRDMAGGSYRRALAGTFIPELVSMNMLMAGMLPVMAVLNSTITIAAGPVTPAFWFIMSMALLVGFLTAYPVNWWLVANRLKHGMITVRASVPGEPDEKGNHQGDHSATKDDVKAPVHEVAPEPSVSVMSMVSFAFLLSGLFVAQLIMVG